MKDTEGKSTEMFEFHFPAKELAGPVLYLRAVGMPHSPPTPVSGLPATNTIYCCKTFHMGTQS